MWQDIKPAPADSILGLTEAFYADTNPNKVNLGVGVYKNEEGETPIMECVKRAEKILLETEKSKSYLPISGDAVYGAEVQKLLFGEENSVIEEKRAITAHAPGGTGALRVGAELLKKFGKKSVWLSSPSWANHRGIFAAAGFEINEYPYYNDAEKKVDFSALQECLQKRGEGDIVLLHACCHNPTGFDLTKEQWQELAVIAKKCGWIPFLDFAYQGFADSIEDDRSGIAAFAKSGIDCIVSSSFSKNFGLYKERVGAITVITPSRTEAETALSHLKTTIRVLYSNPPAHGGLVVKTVLTDADLHAKWGEELAVMRERIKEMRTLLVEGLQKRGAAQDFSYIAEQKGMFSFSGLSPEMVDWLKKEKGIYMVTSGRINAAGLTANNIDYVCDSIAEGLRR